MYYLKEEVVYPIKKSDQRPIQQSTNDINDSNVFQINTPAEDAPQSLLKREARGVCQCAGREALRAFEQKV